MDNSFIVSTHFYNKTKDNDVIEYIYDKVIADYDEKISKIPKEIISEFERAICLRIIDEAWVDHISTMEHLREGIGLRGYSQTNPLQAYAQEGFDIFEKMLDNIDAKISTFLLKAEVRHNIERKQVASGKTNTNDGKEALKTAPKKVKKVGRNEPCPCGSGKKYKQCCGKNA